MLNVVAIMGRLARDPERTQSAQRTTQSAAPSYSSGNNEDFAMIEDEGDLPF